MTQNTFKIVFTLNGAQVSKDIKPSLLLIDLLRNELFLKGTKPGCLEGECGACTVLVDGDAINSCLYPALNINGKEVTTIEGLSKLNGENLLDPVQEAIIKCGAVQCGFCTSGMVMSIRAFVDECKSANHTPGREEIKHSLEGNLCRCTGYTKIVDAVEWLCNKV